MAFVAVAAYVGTAVGLTGVAATIGGGALIGAGVGGLYSAVTGDGDILNSMLTGGLIGGFGAGIGGALFPNAAVASASPFAAAAPLTAPSTATALTTVPATQTAALTGVNTPAGIGAANLEALALAEGSTTAGMVPAANTGLAAETVLPASMQFTPPVSAAGPSGMKMLGYGLAGTTALSLLGGRQKGAGAGQMPDPGMIRPYEYTSAQTPSTGIYPDPYATAQYDASGNPIMDTRERNYFDQRFAALQPYSAKTGTVNPNLQPEPVTAARGGQVDDEMGGDYSAMGMDQGNLQKGLFGMGYAKGGDIEAEQRKFIMQNIKGSSTKELERTLDALNEQDFLRKNMPAYAESMKPSIMGMMEGAQLKDRMTPPNLQQQGLNISPTVIDPGSGTYGGIASIAKNIDPRTRVNAMADIERGPFDRTAADSVRRVGVGLDRQIGRDANLSAFYEQDPMGRNKMGGARFTQRFEQGGSVQNYGFGGLTMIDDLIRQAEQGQQVQIPKYQFNQGTQQYSMANQPTMGTPSLGGYQFDPSTDRYKTTQPITQPMAAGGMTSLGGYSDGGRMLKGPGDGMSDDIPGVIGNKQPARLADGEFVVPADVVSHLGNGSTDAGAKRLYAMMDQVRKARTGTKKQGKQIKAQKYLPA